MARLQSYFSAEKNNFPLQFRLLLHRLNNQIKGRGRGSAQWKWLTNYLFPHPSISIIQQTKIIEYELRRRFVTTFRRNFVAIVAETRTDEKGTYQISGGIGEIKKDS